MSDIVDSVILTGGTTNLAVSETGVKVTGGPDPSDPTKEIKKDIEVTGGLDVHDGIHMHGSNVTYGSGKSIHTYAEDGVTVQTYMSGREFKVHRWTGSGSARPDNVIIQLDNDAETSDTFLKIKSPSYSHSVELRAGNSGVDILADGESILPAPEEPKDMPILPEHLDGSRKLKDGHRYYIDLYHHADSYPEFYNDPQSYFYITGLSIEEPSVYNQDDTHGAASASLIIDVAGHMPRLRWPSSWNWVNNYSDHSYAPDLYSNTRHRFAVERVGYSFAAVNLAYTAPLEAVYEGYSNYSPSYS